MIYLKAFEVTKGTRLSAARLRESSNEWVGCPGLGMKQGVAVEGERECGDPARGIAVSWLSAWIGGLL